MSAAHGLDVTAGIEFQRERGTSSYITDDNGEIPIQRYVAGIFGEARFDANDRFFATAGVRVDNIHRDAVGALNDPFSLRPALDADTVVSVNPKIAAAYQPRSTRGSETKLRGSLGTGIRPPDAFELASSNTFFWLVLVPGSVTYCYWAASFRFSRRTRHTLPGLAVLAFAVCRLLLLPLGIVARLRTGLRELRQQRLGCRRRLAVGQACSSLATRYDGGLAGISSGQWGGSADRRVGQLVGARRAQRPNTRTG